MKLEIEEDALKFLSSLPEKSRRVMKKHCLALAKDPFPGKGGDKEALHIHGFRTLYRLHVGRSYTVFYRIFEDLQAVRILDIMVRVILLDYSLNPVLQGGLCRSKR